MLSLKYCVCICITLCVCVMFFYNHLYMPHFILPLYIPLSSLIFLFFIHPSICPSIYSIVSWCQLCTRFHSHTKFSLNTVLEFSWTNSGTFSSSSADLHNVEANAYISVHAYFIYRRQFLPFVHFMISKLCCIHLHAYVLSRWE